MSAFGGSVSSREGGRAPLTTLQVLAAEKKAAKTAHFRRLAPAKHKDEFIVATKYDVAGTERINFQYKLWDGEAYTSRTISAIEASRMEDLNPGIVVVVEKRGYSVSGGFKDGRKLPRKHGLDTIDEYSRGRATAPRASIIPTKEFKYVANGHGVPPKVVNSIIRDMDALGYAELDIADRATGMDYGKRTRMYAGSTRRQYELGSDVDLRRKANAKKKREAVKGMYKGETDYAKTHRDATYQATARFL